MMINDSAIWAVGIICVAIGLAAVYASKKGWLK
jgi:hypothetical protein